jgi:hypothetical protein
MSGVVPRSPSGSRTLLPIGWGCRWLAALPVVVLLLSACAATEPTPLIPVASSTDGRGVPFGESGRGAMMPIEETSADDGYGWSPAHPVRLGGYDPTLGPTSGEGRQVAYLNSLWGPEGETVFYERIGICCPFEHFGAPLDRGMLDVYSLTWEGSGEPRLLYLDRYREGPVRVPHGLTTRTGGSTRSLVRADGGSG